MMFAIGRIARRCGINLNYLFAPCTALRRREPLRLPRLCDVSRRTILTALPASGVALMLPQAVPAETTSAVMRLYHEWKIARETANRPETSEAEHNRQIEIMIAAEDSMMVLPSHTPQDLAAKIAAYTSWGDFELPQSDHGLWIEVEALIKGRAPESRVKAPRGESKFTTYCVLF